MTSRESWLPGKVDFRGKLTSRELMVGHLLRKLNSWVTSKLNLNWFEPEPDWTGYTASSWTSLNRFEPEPVWTGFIHCLGLNRFEQVWTGLNQFELVWTSLNWFEPEMVWTGLSRLYCFSLNRFKPVWTVVNRNQFELVWRVWTGTGLNRFELVWTSLNRFEPEPVWTSLN